MQNIYNNYWKGGRGTNSSKIDKKNELNELKTEARSFSNSVDVCLFVLFATDTTMDRCEDTLTFARVQLFVRFISTIFVVVWLRK